MHFSYTSRLVAVLGFVFASGLYAQRGTGHAAVAGPGFAPGSQRSAAPIRAAQSPGPNLGGRPYPVRTDIPTPIGLNAPAASYTGISPGAFKSVNGYGRRGSRGFAGFVGAPLYLPFYGDPSISTFPGYNDIAPPPPDPNAQAMAESQEALAQQIQQLTDEVHQMKSSVGQQQQPPAPAPVANAAPERRPPTPPVTLILRDGQQVTVESYAIMNGTFWNFSKRPVQKIPIGNIDLPASAKATEANGGEFPQISSAQ